MGNHIDGWHIYEGEPSPRVKVRLTDEELRSVVNLPEEYRVANVYVDESGRPMVVFSHNELYPLSEAEGWDPVKPEVEV